MEAEVLGAERGFENEEIELDLLRRRGQVVERIRLG